MDFTEEEKELFSKRDKSLSDPSRYLEDGVLAAYEYSEENAHQVDVTFSYIKRMLLEVAKIKEFDVDPDAKYDMDELLEKELEQPKHLEGFDKKLYKKPEELRSFVANAVKDMNYEEIEEVMSDIHFHNADLNGVMSRNIPKLLGRIIELNNIIESSKEEYVDTFGMVDSQTTESALSEPAEEFPEGFWDDSFFDPNDIEDPFDSVPVERSSERDEIDEEEIRDLLMFVNSVQEIAKCKGLCSEILSKLLHIKSERKLEEYHNDEEFMSRLNAIMDHDPNERTFYYHGTQCLEDAESIVKQGLAMHQEFLSSTAYTEFTPDELILYSRGLAGEVGSDGIVVFEGKRGENIVEELEDKSSVNFSPSGLQGLNVEPEYIVRSKHILGYVDKRNKKVIINPQYERYEELKEKMDSQKSYS